mmetsp:Transcript_100800/g.291469  ORF Transcript_100800/g.291469 Transcript_100800/m.291469 type:complete len:209 (-) Transcript_100800:496-1122(-)
MSSGVSSSKPSMSNLKVQRAARTFGSMGQESTLYGLAAAVPTSHISGFSSEKRGGTMRRKTSPAGWRVTRLSPVIIISRSLCSRNRRCSRKTARQRLAFASTLRNSAVNSSTCFRFRSLSCLCMAWNWEGSAKSACSLAVVASASSRTDLVKSCKKSTCFCKDMIWRLREETFCSKLFAVSSKVADSLTMSCSGSSTSGRPSCFSEGP